MSSSTPPALPNDGKDSSPYSSTASSSTSALSSAIAVVVEARQKEQPPMPPPNAEIRPTHTHARRTSIVFAAEPKRRPSLQTNRASSFNKPSSPGGSPQVQSPASPTKAGDPFPQLTRQRSKSSPPPPPTFIKGVGFDTFDNRDASEFSLTLKAKHKNYKYTRQSRTFLCGTDQNEYSTTALEWLIEELVDDGDEIVCLRVIEKDNKLSSEFQIQEKMYRLEAEKLIQDVIGKNEDDKAISIVLEFAVGKVHDTIQSMIHVYEPVMLIVGTRGRSLGGIQGLLPGSVSKYCLQHSPVPVIVVRPNLKREKKKRERKSDPARRDYQRILDKSPFSTLEMMQNANKGIPGSDTVTTEDAGTPGKGPQSPRASFAEPPRSGTPVQGSGTPVQGSGTPVLGQQSPKITFVEPEPRRGRMISFVEPERPRRDSGDGDRPGALSMLNMDRRSSTPEGGVRLPPAARPRPASQTRPSPKSRSSKDEDVDELFASLLGGARHDDVESPEGRSRPVGRSNSQSGAPPPRPLSQTRPIPQPRPLSQTRQPEPKSRTTSMSDLFRSRSRSRSRSRPNTPSYPSPVTLSHPTSKSRPAPKPKKEEEDVDELFESLLGGARHDH